MFLLQVGGIYPFNTADPRECHPRAPYLPIVRALLSLLEFLQKLVRAQALGLP